MKIKNKTTTESVPQDISISELNTFFNKDEILKAIGTNNLTAATYYACMLIRCNAVAKLPIKVMQKTEKGSEVLKSHQLNDLLRYRPNPFICAHDFMWSTEYQRLEYGNAFWVYDFNNGKISALYLLDSRQVEIVFDNSCLLSEKNAVYYIYNDNKKGNIIYTADNILHFRNFAVNSIKGTPIKKYLYDVINQEKYAQGVVNERYKNGLQDPIVVTYTGDLNDSKKEKVKKKFANMGGVTNAGKVVPIPSDFDIKVLETKLVNSQFFQLNGLTTRHIANAFGVKSFQLNDMEKSTYNNIEQQNKAFYSDTLQNVLTANEQEIDYKLLTPCERNNNIYVKYNVDVMLRSDLTTRYAAYQTGISSGFLTIKEARSKEDLPFIEGTDKLIIGNGASLPLEQLGNQYKKSN